MSHRSISHKKANKLRKAMRRTPPVWLDLVQWLRSHGYAQTAGEARKIIIDKRVKSESHTLGLTKRTVLEQGKIVEREFVAPLVPASVRGTLRVAD